jgi:hypothetical protein
MTNAAIKRALQPQQPKSMPMLIPCKAFTTPSLSTVTRPVSSAPAEDPFPSSDNTIHESTSSVSDQHPRLMDSMNPSYFAIGKAWEAQKTQPFGKNNLVQVYTTQPVFFHILLPVL